MTIHISGIFAFLLTCGMLCASTANLEGECSIDTKGPESLYCRLSTIPDNFFNNRNETKKLNLTKNNIQTLKSGAFNGLVVLETLDLTDNGITNLPEGVFKPLKLLKEVKLANNNLSSIDFNQFADNKNLRIVKLQNNAIDKIQPIIVPDQEEFGINDLWLSDNKLVNVSELCKLKNLKHFKLNNNPSLDYKSLNFSCWPELAQLNLENTGLKRLNHDYKSFAGLVNLNYLNLGKNDLRFFNIMTFPQLNELGHLHIQDNKLQTLNVTELKLKLKNLRYIELYGNHWNCERLDEMKKDSVKLAITVGEKKELQCNNEPVIQNDIENDAVKIVTANFNLSHSKIFVFVVVFCICAIFATIIFVVMYCKRS